MVQKIHFEDIVKKTARPRFVLTAVVNLSSGPSDWLTNKISQFMGIESKLSLLHINRHNTMTNESGLIIPMNNTTSAWFIVDEDDELYNIKIRNISILQNIKARGIIILPVCPSSKRTMVESGIVTLVSAQMDKPTCKLLGARQFLNLEEDLITSAIILKPQVKLLSSIAGLTCVLKDHDLPYDIKRCIVAQRKSWLLLKPFELKQIHAINHSSIVDKVVQGDKRWVYKCGYTDIINTNKGPKTFMLNEDNRTKMHRGTFSQFYFLFTSMIDKIHKLFLRLRKMLTRDKRSYDSISKAGLRMNPLYSLPYVSSLTVFNYINYLPANASKEIDSANDLMARWHVNRMQQKATGKSDKLELVKKISKAKASYIVGSTGFNVQDAALTADIKIVKDNRKKASTAMLVNMIICLIVCGLTAKFIRMPALILISILGYITDEQELAVIISGFISPTGIISKALLASNAIIHYSKVLSKKVMRTFMPVSMAIIILTQLTVGTF
jgi:hypothetical protein